MNNSNIGYIVMPMGLTIEQREVYTYLYEKCNFQDMTVEYTVSQIVVDSDKRLNLTPMKVRTILKKFLLNGYIVDIHKGSKGNPSTLKIITIKQQLNNNNITNKIAQPSQLQEVSNNNVTNKQQIYNNPIKEKEKENNIYISKDILVPKDLEPIVQKWNSLNLSKINSIKNNRLKMLKARIKDYGIDKVLEAIDNISKSDFLKGQNNKNWTITFDWFIRPNNFDKVLDGNYNNKVVSSKSSFNYSGAD